MSKGLRAASLSDVGRTRERNEDASFVGRAVFAVADGLGGHNAGDVASNLALDSIAALDEGDAKKAAHHVADAVRKSNRAVYERAQQDAGLRGMGTTMTALVVHDGQAHVAHVGDSRCYLVRGGQITQLSHDHTLVARMVSEGKLTPEQAEVHPQRSILTRALGADRDVDVEEVRVALATGDRLVLCSDGLSGVVTPDEIRDAVRDGADLDEICRALIDAANARGGPDNITVVVIDVGEVAGVARPLPGIPSEGPRRARRVSVRALVWAAVVVGVALGGYFGVRSWANRSYYVGVHEGRVVIYRGLPVEVASIELSSVEEGTPILVEQIRNPSVKRSLVDGIRAPSLEEARDIIQNRILPAVRVPDVGGRRQTPSPSPSPSPTRKRR